MGPVRQIVCARGAYVPRSESSYLVPLLCVYLRAVLYVAALDTAQSLRNLFDDPPCRPVRRYPGKLEMPLGMDPQAVIAEGEAVGLRVRDVEFLRRRLSVSENAVQLGVDHAVGPTKGRKARSVPVPQFVLNELSAQCKGKAPGDLVFAGRDGGYLPRPKSTGGWFSAAVKRAKVQTVTPHDLRHTCASLAVSARVNVLALQRMLGHTSAKITLDTYADLFDDDLDAVAESLHSDDSPSARVHKCAQNVLKSGF